MRNYVFLVVFIKDKGVVEVTAEHKLYADSFKLARPIGIHLALNVKLSARIFRCHIRAYVRYGKIKFLAFICKHFEKIGLRKSEIVEGVKSSVFFGNARGVIVLGTVVNLILTAVEAYSAKRAYGKGKVGISVNVREKIGISFGKSAASVVVAAREYHRHSAFAYLTEENTLVTNDKDGLAKRLGEAYDGKRKHLLRKTERFAMAPAGAALPTVSEAGIARCLTSWRTGVRFSSNEAEMRFLLCTRETEYVFSIQPKEDNIYCGASYHKVFDLGLFGGIQFFRIRHYADDTLPFCTFFASFTQQAKNVKIPTNECVLGGCVQTKEGILWCVKRYHDDEIVLQGCGEDEYIYRRDECKSEALLFP